MADRYSRAKMKHGYLYIWSEYEINGSQIRDFYTSETTKLHLQMKINDDIKAIFKMATYGEMTNEVRNEYIKVLC